MFAPIKQMAAGGHALKNICFSIKKENTRKVELLKEYFPIFSNNSNMDTSSMTICQVINIVDKKLMTIATQWTDDKYLQIFILRKGMEPLKGETCMRKLLEPAKNFNKTEEQYFEEIKRELAGQDKEAEFSVRGMTFQWKKKAWKRGLIECQCFNDVIEFSASIMDVIMCCSNMESNAVDFRAENEALRIRVEDLERSLSHVIDLKNHMEEELYKKFIVLLNSKKRKNQEVFKAKLKSSSTVYDESTDESETQESENSSTNNCQPVLRTINTSNNDSDESFVLKVSQSPPHEISDEKITHNDVSGKESDQDLFSD